MKYSDTRFYTMQTDKTGVLWARGKCSFFGGADDPMDSGSTASGYSTRDHPNDPYVALPRPVRRRYRIPWGARVTVENSHGEQVRGFLVDTGPAMQTGRYIDLSNIFNAELGVNTDDLVKFYVDVHTIDARFTHKAGMGV